MGGRFLELWGGFKMEWKDDRMFGLLQTGVVMAWKVCSEIQL